MSDEGAGQQDQPDQSAPRADEDWKRKVEKEREQLREETPADEAVAHEDASGGEAAQGEPEQEAGAGAELPQLSFISLLAGLGTQALIALGAIPNPVTGEHAKSLREASYLIDTINMLRAKTEGNLDDEEKNYIGALLGDLRMRYVQATQAPKP